MYAHELSAVPPRDGAVEWSPRSDPGPSMAQILGPSPQGCVWPFPFCESCLLVSL